VQQAVPGRLLAAVGDTVGTHEPALERPRAGERRGPCGLVGSSQAHARGRYVSRVLAGALASQQRPERAGISALG
jgi:hypothetical protein